MKENHLGAAISFLVHSCVILPLVAASFSVQNRPVKVVEVDFLLIKDQFRERPAPKVDKKITEKNPRILKGGKSPGKIIEPDRPVKQNPDNAPAKEQAEPPPVPAIVTASDTTGGIAVHGTPATYAGSSGSGRFLQPHGGFADGVEGSGQGGGQGGESLAEGSKGYDYIRDAIMKNIEYPEWARKMGLEGRAILSFMVLENGNTSRITIVKSSGHRLLDDSAIDGVAKTVISRKVPYRVVVRLPITYKLQPQRDGRR